MSLWNQCLERLRQELPTQQFSMWIRPLVCEEQDGYVALYAPNRFVLDWVRDKYLNNITALLREFAGADAPQLHLEVMSRQSLNRSTPAATQQSSQSNVNTPSRYNAGNTSTPSAAPYNASQPSANNVAMGRDGQSRVPTQASPNYSQNNGSFGYQQNDHNMESARSDHYDRASNNGNSYWSLLSN